MTRKSLRSKRPLAKKCTRVAREATKRTHVPPKPATRTMFVAEPPIVAPEPAGPRDWIMLDGFKMERQCHTKWCWAAVAEAVLRYYDRSSNQTQRTIAKMLMPEFKNDFDAPCYNDDRLEEDNRLEYNQDQLLLSALLLTDCFEDLHRTPDEPAPLEKIQEWIDGGRAVCARIRWPNQTAHFVAITGYRPGTKSLQVWDPWGPQARNLSYDEVAQHYTSLDANLADTSLEGKWVDTHFTKRPAAKAA